MKRGKGIRGMIIFLLLIFMLVGYYFYLSNRTKASGGDEEETTQVQEILLRDLERNYPASPKEVLKYYSELTKCLYNEDCSDEELDQLARKAMELYDEELAGYQSELTYVDDVKEEVASFRKDDIQISSYKTSASTDVDYFTKDGKECARLYCTYTVRQGTSLSSVEEVFVLRKNEAGHWKIYGWQKADPNAKQRLEEDDQRND